MARKSNNLVGVTGEYYVCAELCNLGVLALLTPKNNPIFDIVAVAPDASRAVTIQVKTMSVHNNAGWKLGKDICLRKNNPNLFTVLVNLSGNQVEFYIYEYDVLSEKVENAYSEYLNTPKRNGGSRKDIDFRWWDFKMFKEDDHSRRNAWERLGF